MILESGILSVKAGQGAAFEAAFRAASPIIRGMPGYIRHELHRCIETPGSLSATGVVGNTGGAHGGLSRRAGVPGVEGAPASLLHPFPTIEHFAQVDLGRVTQRLTPPDD